jgi:hypothetical protein
MPTKIELMKRKKDKMNEIIRKRENKYLYQHIYNNKPNIDYYNVPYQCYQVIERGDFDNKNIIDYKQFLAHDGYDADGPESNLWDLVIVTREGNKYVYYNYHREDWFSGEKEQYELYSVYINNDLVRLDNVMGMFDFDKLGERIYCIYDS